LTVNTAIVLIIIVIVTVLMAKFAMRVLLFILRHLDYLAVAALGLYYFAQRDTGLTAIYGAIAFVVCVLVWYFLCNYIHIAKIYPFRWIGVFICGLVVYLAISPYMNQIWTWIVTLLATLCVAAARLR